MKNMKLKIAGAMMLAGFAGGNVWAGAVSSSPVSISGNTASGSIHTARYSSDSVQSIGCGSYGGSGFCLAASASGAGGSCATTDAALIDVMRAINPGSYVYFQWDASGNCTYVLVNNNSQGL